MRGAREAGVVRADRHLDAVEQAFGEFLPVEIFARHRAHGLVHGLVVVRGRDDQVAHRDQVVVADAVVVDQRAARRLDDAHAFADALPRRHQVAREDVRVGEQLLDHLGGMQRLDHARPVVGQRGVHRRALAAGDEDLPLRLGPRRRDEVAVLHPRQRADAVPAQLAAERLQVRELHVGPGPHFLLDQLEVALITRAIEHDLACGIARAQHAVIEIHGAVGAHQRQHVGTEAAETVVQAGIALVQLPRDSHGVLCPGDGLADVALQHVAVFAADVLVHAAGHRARAVHALAGGDADHLLAELAQHHALLGDVRVLLDHADDVALLHLGVEAEQQVGRREVEEVQRMRL